MNTLQKHVLAALVSALPLSAALADGNMVEGAGPYLAAGAGWDFANNSNLNVNGLPATLDFHYGWGMQAAIGYKWDIGLQNSGLRTEVEGSYREDNIKNVNAVPWFGQQADSSVMINALYEFTTEYGISPYAGGGLGASHLSWNQNFGPPAVFNQAFRAPNGSTYDDSSTRPAWQAIVGVAWAIYPRLQITADYRYKGTLGNDDFNGSAAGTSITGYTYRDQSILFGVRYAFN